MTLLVPAIGLPDIQIFISYCDGSKRICLSFSLAFALHSASAPYRGKEKNKFTSKGNSSILHGSQSTVVSFPADHITSLSKSALDMPNFPTRNPAVNCSIRLGESYSLAGLITPIVSYSPSLRSSIFCHVLLRRRYMRARL